MGQQKKRGVLQLVILRWSGAIGPQVRILSPRPNKNEMLGSLVTPPALGAGELPGSNPGISTFKHGVVAPIGRAEA